MLAFGIYAGWRWWTGRAFVSTDNAQVQGDIVPILPKVSGFVADVRVRENQNVKPGDVLVTIDDRDLRRAWRRPKRSSQGDGQRRLARRHRTAQAELAAARAQ